MKTLVRGLVDETKRSETTTACYLKRYVQKGTLLVSEFKTYYDI